MSANDGASRVGAALLVDVPGRDEFRSVVWNLPDLPCALLDLRRRFAPSQVYIAVGWGAIAGWQRPADEALTGAAFGRARQAMSRLKSARGDKFRRLTCCDTGDAGLDALLNLVYALNDSLVQQITERQWQTIASALIHDNQEHVAAELGVQPSTVTRNLKRGHYWQIRATADELSRLLIRPTAGRMPGSPEAGPASEQA